VIVERLAALAVIALGLVVAGAVIVAPDLSLETRGAALGAIAAAFLLVGRASRRRGG
jgi:hypothetical protein